MPRTVSVGEFATGAEAALAQGLLEEEGITSHLSGEMGQAWAFGMGPLDQTVRLEVLEDDAERARALLDTLDARIRERVRHEIDEERGDGAPAETELPVETESDPASPEDWEPPSDTSPADRAARRLLVGAVIGLAFGIAMWATLFVWILRPPPEEGLTEVGRRRMRIVRVLVAVWVVKLVLLWSALRSLWVVAT